jgi:hypothetical protein
MKHKSAAGGAAILVVALTAGCGNRPSLVPAPTAKTLVGDGKIAVARDAGVQVEADGKAWSGEPSNLESAIAPVKVTLRNNSGRPLRVRYADFTLATVDGFSSAALPPMKISGTLPGEPIAVTRPVYGWKGYWLGRYYSPWYPGYGVWGGPFAWDFPYYTTYYARWPVALPTEDMIRKAIPEGVLSSGGSVEGFLYFPQVPEGVERANLVTTLTDARTGQEFGSLTIPFEVKR